LSARATNVGGTVTPIALAVFRLITSELGRLLDWDVGDLGAAQELNELSSNKVSKDLIKARSIVTLRV
jgi:hypothetical protein